jgi:predicted DNA-binding transcriptional regulator
MNYVDYSDYISSMEYLQAKMSKHMSIKTSEDFEKIKNHPKTNKIQYPTFKESFDYVNKIFPSFDITSIVILEADKDFLKKLGYGGAGGLYSPLWKAIVTTDIEQKKTKKRKFDIQATLTKDEVIVHELLHYCSDMREKTNTSSDIEEEFAYGWSYGYLKQKGYSDIEIINQNYLPYLFSTVDHEKVLSVVAKEENIVVDFNALDKKTKKKMILKIRDKLHNKSLEFAMERGQQIIRIYAQKLKLEPDEKKEEVNENNRWELMDI